MGSIPFRVSRIPAQHCFQMLRWRGSPIRVTQIQVQVSMTYLGVLIRKEFTMLRNIEIDWDGKLARNQCHRENISFEGVVLLIFIKS